MCKIINSLKEEAKNTINFIERLPKFSPEWTEPVPISKRIRIGQNAGLPGVYRIIYKPTGKVMSVGQGVKVSARKACHTNVFRNKGVALEHNGSYVTDSPVARKMFEYDSNIDNWYFSFVTFKESWMARIYEKYLQHKIIPEFNDLGFAGK